MSKRWRLVLILVALLTVVAAAWVGCGPLGRFVRVMHGKHTEHLAH
jgi:hypothetical protein